ncbi:unnamed protein product [Ambrosiozyma monospora]|uniref:Unnamed protein product n=1 Tax=Ambrosiozyma monospora TaxID=43982 RepID=A0ACB5TND5_AMBMO|nr:unnamed protein product [Ambrosiozyma monospora]
MQLNLKTITAVLATLSLVSADDNSAIASPDSAVVKLTQDTFEQYIKSNPLVLAEFFAPWCGHCKRLGPEFSSAADKLAEKDIKLAQIDCTEERDLCADFGIRGYPTLKVFRGEGEPSDYQGQREANAIYNYMLKQASPPVTSTEDSAEILEVVSDAADPVIVQVLPSGVTKNNETFYDVANSLRDSYTFISTSNADYVKKYTKKSNPTYVLFRPEESADDASVYSGKEFDEEHLKEFIEVESKPLFGEINGYHYQVGQRI